MNALWGAEMSAAHEDLGPTDVHLVHLPRFHTNAQVYSVLAPLWAGATLVLQPKFSASRFWPVFRAPGLCGSFTLDRRHHAILPKPSGSMAPSAAAVDE
jgi:hypothetical protein